MARLEVAQEVDHLRLDGAIERGGGLVEDDQPGLQHERPGERDALPLAAGQLVRDSGRASPARARPRPAPRRSGPRAPRRSGRWRGRRALRRRSARRTSAARASRRDPGRRSASPGGAAGAPPRRVPGAPGPGTGSGRRCRSRRRSARPSVVLPEPLSPTTPTVWPSRTVTLTPSTALTWSTVRRSTPAFTGNQTFTPSAVRTTGAAVGGAGGRGDGSAARRRRVYGCRGRSKISAVVPVSTISPWLMTAHAVGHLADDAEVVGDEEERHAEARLEVPEQLQDLRLDGDVERRRRLVRDQEIGLVGERHRDHHPLPLAARELVRIRVQAPLGLGQPDEVQELHASAPGPRGGRAPCGRSSTSLTCFSIVWSGLSDVIGSWKIIAIRFAAHAPERRLVGAQQLLALEHGCCRRDAGPAGTAGAAGSTARSPTSRSRSRPRARRSRPRAMSSETPRTARTSPPGVSNETARSRIAEEGRRRRHAVFRGSNASRTASPMKTSRLSITARTTKPVMPSHGAWRFALPWARISPSDGEPGRQAEAEEVERGQRRDRAAQDERQEGQRGDHRVRAARGGT